MTPPEDGGRPGAEPPDPDDFVATRDETLDAVVGFARSLRSAGIQVPVNAAVEATRALSVVGRTDKSAVRAAMRATLLSRREDVETFEDLFERFWRELRAAGREPPAVLDDLADHDLREVDFMRSGWLEIAGVEVRAVRFGMSGELGFELHGPAEGKEDVWEAIREAGEPYGLHRLSVKTSSINQLESGIASRVRDYVSAIFEDYLDDYREYLKETATRDLITPPVEGSFDADDISGWYRNPVELGWGRYINDDHDFVGREALEPKLEDPDRQLVTLRWDSGDVVDVYASLYEDDLPHKYMDMPHQQKRAMVADRVLIDGEDVGVATMRGYSYYFREMLSLATIDVEHAEPGTEVTVLWGEGEDPMSPTVENHSQREIGATVAPTPYKEDRRMDDPDST